jgi:hypothetical protein
MNKLMPCQIKPKWLYLKKVPARFCDGFMKFPFAARVQMSGNSSCRNLCGFVRDHGIFVPPETCEVGLCHQYIVFFAEKTLYAFQRTDEGALILA